MSVFSALYKSVSGLIGFNQGLDNLSNNVANMNTPGYKGRDKFFSELAYAGEGEGVQVSGSSIRMQQGDVTETGNATDAAIEGNGFFILSRGGDDYYTRNGQFRFDDNGYLTDSTGQYRVASYEGGGRVSDFVIDFDETIAPIATSQVRLSGNLNSGAAQGDTYPEDPVVNPMELSILDESGVSVPVRLVWTKGVGNSWSVQAKNSSNTDIGSPSVLQFSADGSPSNGSENFEVSVPTSGGSVQTIEFVLGVPGDFSGVTGFSSSSSDVDPATINGKTLGRVTDVAFDSEGQMLISFSNGDERLGPQLALAHFSDPDDLLVRNDSVFFAPSEVAREVGVSGDGVFGIVSGASIELSNVELALEFSDLIIVQRGYQACSQVMNATNELVEDLYNSTRSG